MTRGNQFGPFSDPRDNLPHYPSPIWSVQPQLILKERLPGPNANSVGNVTVNTIESQGGRRVERQYGRRGVIGKVPCPTNRNMQLALNINSNDIIKIVAAKGQGNNDLKTMNDLYRIMNI